jgi:hypothetical protein
METVMNPMHPAPERQYDHQENENPAEKAVAEALHPGIGCHIVYNAKRYQKADNQNRHRREDAAPHAAGAEQSPEYRFI